jgi:hypothetical protein
METQYIHAFIASEYMEVWGIVDRQTHCQTEQKTQENSKARGFMKNLRQSQTHKCIKNHTVKFEGHMSFVIQEFC